MSNDEKLYFIEKRVESARSVLLLIKSELSNKDGTLSKEVIKGALSGAILCLDDLNNLITE